MFELIPFDRRGNRMSAYDPFRMLDEMERSFFGGNTHAALSSFRTDVTDTGEAFVLDAELPGFKRERFYGSYSRSFDVSGVNVDGIEAEYSDGVLKLTMPKKVETVPPTRRLEIK